MHPRKTVLSRIRENYIASEREKGGRVKAKKRKEEKRGIWVARLPSSLSPRLITSGTAHLLTLMCPPQPFFLLCRLSGNSLHSGPTITSLTWILNTELRIYQLPCWPSYHQILYPLSHSHYQTNLPKTFCSPHWTKPSVAHHCPLTKAQKF